MRREGGKIYVGEPEPFDEVADEIRRGLGTLGALANDGLDALLGRRPQPVLVPIPIPMDPTHPNDEPTEALPPYNQGGDWGMGRF